MKAIKLFLFLFFSLTTIFACQTNTEQKSDVFAANFEGDWKLVRLDGVRGVADSVVKKFPITLNVEDTAFLFRQSTQYGQATYRNWIFKDSVLLLPYSNATMKEDTLNFKVLDINETKLVLERKNNDLEGLDTLYFEKY